jgi:hypothetical protein
MATDHGSDISCVFDVDANLTVVTGRLVLGQAIARRWLATPGSLFYDPTYGAGLIGFLSGTISTADEIASVLEDEALKDERVDACKVAVTVVGRTLEIQGLLTDGEGPFPMTLNVSEVSATLLLEAA